MAPFFISTLCISVIAMVSMLALKRYELTSGKVVFAGVRPKLSAWLQTTSQWSQKILPALVRHNSERVTKLVMKNVQLALAQSIVKFEQLLERVLSVVREKTDHAHPEREPSAFLREVADHKKNLLYKKSLLKKPHPHDTVQE